MNKFFKVALFWRRLVVILPLVFILCHAHSAFGEGVVLNFRNTDVRTVLEAVGKMTGKTFILEAGVKGSLSILSTNPVPENIAFDTVLAALRLQGYSATESNGTVIIATEAKNRTMSGKILEGKQATEGREIITQIITLQYESTTQLMNVLRPFVSPGNLITEYAKSNTFVITDYADSVERIMKIIETFDKPKKGTVEIIQLKYIAAADFISLFQQIYGYGAAQGTAAVAGSSPSSGLSARQFVLLPDSRSNSLILRSENPTLTDQVKELLQKLDVPTNRTGSIRVVKLKYADPAKLAAILNGIQIGEKQQKTGAGDTTTQAISPATPTPGGNAPGIAPSMTGMAGMGDTAKAGGDSKAAAVAVKAGIQADESTGSIIISGPENVYNMYRAIIDELDVPRKQVYVEALIVEVTSSRLAEFGIQWQSSRGLDTGVQQGVSGIGGTNFGSVSGNASSGIGAVTTNASSGVNLGNGLNIGIVNGTVTMPNGTVLPNLLSLAHALQNDSKVNVLSTPTLLTMENEEAKIIVGQNVPFVTGSYSSSSSSTSGSSSVNPFQTIERKDIGLTLKVKPRVSADDVKLTIYQEVSSIATTAKSTTGSSDIITNKRSVETSVMVKDGQIVALGGLMQDNVNVTENKVPILGSIPILGHLFRYDSRNQEKTNLMVFLRPYVVTDSEDVKPLVSKSYNEMRKSQEDTQADPHLLLPGVKMPIIPEYEDSKPLQKSGKPAPEVVKPEAVKPKEPESSEKKDKSAQEIKDMFDGGGVIQGDAAMGKTEEKVLIMAPPTGKEKGGAQPVDIQAGQPPKPKPEGEKPGEGAGGK